MSEDDILKLKWNGHLSSFLHIFQSLRTKSRYTDVTLACEGRLFTVHRLVLASCSQFFDHIFEQTPSENTVIVLNEAKAHDIESLLDYMYCGQVDVQQRDLGSFIRTARCLQIKGLASPDDIRNFVEEEILDDQPYKKRKSNCVPSVDSTPTQNVMPSFPTSTIGTKIDISKKAISASSPNTLPSCWVFQQSDLPNTTWSSSPNSKLDDSRSEKENYPQREYIENNVVPVNCNKNLIIDESPAINSSPHSNNLNNFQYISNLPGSTDGVHSCRLNKDAKDDYYHRNSDFNEEPIDFKKEIKDEEDDKFCKDNRNHEKYVEYSPARYPVISELDHSSEVVENYDQFSDLSSAATCENQTITDSPRIISQSRPLIPLKFVKKVTPTTIPPAGWRNCPGTKPISEHDSNVGPIRSTSSNNQSSVSPKLMLYAKCSNCQTNNTKLWRRSLQGEIVCNACGLYYKLHGVNRPSHLFRNAPMTRRRTPRSKKKRSYDQILDGREREQQLSVEELNDSLYNESGCESDTQESLAMLNAALTLNSLLAKAKAQEAAVKNLELDLSASPSNARVGCDSSSTTNEGLPPPPPLLKISLQSSGAINESSHQSVGHSPPTNVITVKSHTTDSSTTNSVIIGLNESRPPSHSDCEDLSTKS